ncbi:MAG: glutamine--fructose-6-phosphate transaminase (isomerizing), partial [Actinomycetota bacterium]
MCGIVGYVGEEPALPFMMDGLKRLEYRGYDSAGIAVVENGAIEIVKKAGKLEVLEKALVGHESTGTCGIGHTRWATHGGPNDANAHPHTDCSGRIAIIHNGIIENFLELRDRLREDGHELRSETDTEAIAHLIESEMVGNLTAAVRKALAQVTGAFSIAVVSADEPGLVVAAKRTSPLIVGVGAGGTMLASDPTALLPITREMVHILDDQVVEIRADGYRITTLEGADAEGQAITVEGDLVAVEKGGYDDFMLKEIYEQPAAVRDTLRGRTHDGGRIVMDELRLNERDVRNIDKVFVVACGTAFHAGLVAKYAIEHWTRLPVEIEIASEFRYRDPILDRDTLVVAVSQSGETIDTLEAVRHAREQHAKILTVSNTVGSSIPRESDGVLYMRAGPEIGVAATKTFTTQITALEILALWLAQVRGSLYAKECAEIVEEMHRLPELIRRALECRPAVKRIADDIASCRDVLFIGRHVGYPSALEGALKLKEISYLHAEGYAAGELKHGPIALIEEGVPVIAIANRCHVYEKVISNIQEVKARGANVIAVVTEGDTEAARHADSVIEVPETENELLAPIVT